MRSKEQQQAMDWLVWHMRQKERDMEEFNNGNMEERFLYRMPQPPRVIYEHIDALEYEHYKVQTFFQQLERYTQMVTGSSTEKEKEESLSSLLIDFSNLLEAFPKLSPNYSEENTS